MKSRFVKIAALLLVAVLATSCALSSTLAYYSTEVLLDETTAGIAQWRWNNVSVTSSALFPENGKIAPGASGSATYQVKDYPKSSNNNAPEVDYIYGWNVEIDSAGIEGLLFCETENGTYVDAETFIENIETKNNKRIKEAGQYPTESDMTLSIYWKWEDNDTETDPDKLDFNKEVSVTVKFFAEQDVAGGV